jgi:nucleoid DNA-binding protein
MAGKNAATAGTTTAATATKGQATDGATTRHRATGKPQSEVFGLIGEKTGLTPKQVRAVWDAFGEFAAKELGKRGAGVVNLPGLGKLTRAMRPARKARTGRNPATGESMQIPAQKARATVRFRAAKALKDAI